MRRHSPASRAVADKSAAPKSHALPKNYGAVGDDILRELIKTLAPVDIDGDAFGRVYEYFMGEFAQQEIYGIHTSDLP